MSCLRAVELVLAVNLCSTLTISVEMSGCNSRDRAVQQKLIAWGIPGHVLLNVWGM